MMQKVTDDPRAAEQRQLSVGMKRLVVQFRSLLESMLEQEGMTLAQLRMLHALSERPETSAAELARICYVTPQSMQSIVTRAEESGWISRSASAANRRVLVAHLTADGRRALRRGVTLSSRIERQIWSDASVDELKMMNSALATSLERLQRVHDQHHAAAGKRKTA